MSSSTQNVLGPKVPAKPVSADYLNGPGCVRVQHLMYLYNRSHSAINRKIREGRIPAPTGHDPRPYWSNEVIRQHLNAPTAQTGVIGGAA
jgi:hypothetical protein